MKKSVENRTMSIVLAELNASVDSYNSASTPAEKASLSVAQKLLVEEYNTMSMLSAYAACMKEPQPILALAKTYYFDVVSTKDTLHNEVIEGVQHSSVTRSVKDGVKRLDLVKFIEWTEEHNKSVASDRYWKTKTEEARACIIEQWKKFFASKGDTHTMSIGQTKKKLQAMADALVFIKTETDKNAVVVDNSCAKWMLGFANNRKDSKAETGVAITGNILNKSTWSVLIMDMMHKLATGKDYELIYGDPEESAEEAVKAEAEATK